MSFHFPSAPVRCFGALAALVALVARHCPSHGRRRARHRRHLHDPGLSPGQRRCATRYRAWHRCRARAATRCRPSRDPAGRPRTALPARASPAIPNDAFPRRAEPAPAPKPNEFQRFVEGATGRLLPIFGSAFFADAADNFQSLDNVPVSADYTIGPGDEIVTRAWGAIDVDYRSTVDRNGMLNLPKVGSFNVAGVKAADLEKNLRGADRRASTPTSSSRSRSASCAACASSSSARHSGPASITLVEPVDAALGGGRRGRAEPDRLDAQDPAAPRRPASSPSSTSTSSWSRATSRRTCSSPPATSSSSSRPGRASRSPARSTRRRSTS